MLTLHLHTLPLFSVPQIEALINFTFKYMVQFTEAIVLAESYYFLLILMPTNAP